MVWQKLFGEKATTKIAACFDSEEKMNRLASALRAGTQLPSGQMKVVRPGEHHFGRKLEPEGRGIARTAVRAHIILGLAGLVLGLFIWLVLYFFGVPAITSSPGLGAGVFLAFGAIAGMMLGGLITARPDHDLVIEHVRTASEEGRWSLVIHPLNPAQCDAVMRVLSEAGVESVRSV